MLRLLLKFLWFLMVIASPIISFKALYEYFQIEYLNKKPTYPFGSAITKVIQNQGSQYLSDYKTEMLYIGLIFLALTTLIYLAMIVKSLINIAKIAAVLALFYFFYLFLA
ncbi:MAG: hypothetical protein ACK4K9_01870 [Bacteroidia bacterium]